MKRQKNEEANAEVTCEAGRGRRFVPVNRKALLRASCSGPRPHRSAADPDHQRDPRPSSEDAFGESFGYEAWRAAVVCGTHFVCWHQQQLKGSVSVLNAQWLNRSLQHAPLAFDRGRSFWAVR